MATILVLASLWQTIATSAPVGTAGTTESATSASAATAALADGDDIRARFLVGPAGEPLA
jgi:hypothetical protein